MGLGRGITGWDACAERFIRRGNIKRSEHRLKDSSDEHERKVLRDLLSHKRRQYFAGRKSDS
jgi:hypothetical protein